MTSRSVPKKELKWISTGDKDGSDVERYLNLNDKATMISKWLEERD